MSEDDKPSIIKELEDSEMIVDILTICPYCGREVNASMWTLGCCGESSDHFIEAYLFNDDSIMTEEEVLATYKSSAIH
jgi:hypothetical protein